MNIHLEGIVQPTDLAHLHAPFTRVEIDDVVKEFPINKALGPDGFNEKFLKKASQ
jgi:hypothetical protein